MQPDELHTEEKRTLYQRMRQSMLPVKETDGSLVRHSKNVGFAVLGITFLLVSLVIVAAVAFVL